MKIKNGAKILKVTVTGSTEVLLKDLIVIQGNLKDLDTTGYEAMRSSIEKHGFCEPFTIWERPDDKALCILSGTQRYRVVSEMEKDNWQIPLLPANLILDCKTIEEALSKALVMAGSYGKVTHDGLYELVSRIGGDTEKLLESFRSQTIDNDEFLRGYIHNSIPLSENEILNTITGEVTELKVNNPFNGLTDEDEAPPPPKKAKAKMGEIYMLGKHRLMCGDSTSKADVAKLMNNQKAKAWISDPPYGINHVEVSQEKGQSKGYSKIVNDELQDDALREFIFKVIETSKPHLEKGFAFYMWHAMKMQAYFSQAAAAAAAAAGILFHRQIIWVKERFVFGRGHYHWQHELCLMGWMQGDEPPFYGERNQTTIWKVERENDKIHPTQKPVKLYEIPILNHLKAGEIFMEPFGGSGSGIIAAEKCGVKCYCMEFDPIYIDVIIERWEKFTGKKAQKVEIKKKPKK